jgi:hypothetical protein
MQKLIHEKGQFRGVRLLFMNFGSKLQNAICMKGH